MEKTTDMSNKKMNKKPFVFFLGGRDLEMSEIKEMIQTYFSGQYFDKNLTWGAATSHYEEEIKTVLANGEIPVFVELKLDQTLPEKQYILIDHHNDKSGADKATAIQQVFKLLELPESKWSRWYDLVSENDKGHIKALQAYGASQEEIIKVRRLDRSAQGITKKDELTAKEAILKRKDFLQGELTVITLPSNKTSPVADQMETSLGGPGYKNLLIESPNELNFFGSGEHIKLLNKQYPGGWYGGNLPEHGFWGVNENIPAQKIIELFSSELNNIST